MNTLYLIGRLVLGIYFVMAGLKHFANTNALAGYAASKGLPHPRAGVLVTGAMLVLGGLGVFFHVQLDIAYALLIIFLVAAAFTIHTFWKVHDPMAAMTERINFEKNLALAAALLMLAVAT